jgi:hypothetical protein
MGKTHQLRLIAPFLAVIVTLISSLKICITTSITVVSQWTDPVSFL